MSTDHHWGPRLQLFLKEEDYDKYFWDDIDKNYWPQLEANAYIIKQIENTVTFEGEAHNGPSPYSYEWDFGDGTTSNEQNPEHTYSGKSTYSPPLPACHLPHGPRHDPRRRQCSQSRSCRLPDQALRRQRPGQKNQFRSLKKYREKNRVRYQ